MKNAKPPRLSLASLKVLKALMDGPRTGLSGSEITQLQGIASGSLYPILARLEDAGWLRSDWETDQAEELGRPRRRYYTLTADGYRFTTEAIRELLPARGHTSPGEAWA